MSDHGARVAAGRIGCTVEEYRAREAAGEHWCPRCENWIPAARFHVSNGRRGGYCSACDQAYRSGLLLAERIFLTPEGAAATRVPSAAAPEGRPDAELDAYPVQRGSGHSLCPAVLGCHEGRIPGGWIRQQHQEAR